MRTTNAKIGIATYAFWLIKSLLQVHCVFGKMIADPPSDCPAPDRTYCWLKDSRCISLCLFKLGFTYSWLPLYLLIPPFNPFMSKLKHGHRARGLSTTHKHTAKSAFWGVKLIFTAGTAHSVRTQLDSGLLARRSFLTWEERPFVGSILATCR